MSPKRRKTIGHLYEKYWRDVNDAGKITAPIFQEVIEEFRMKAKQFRQPCWYVKNAYLYFTYEDGVHRIHSGHFNCSDEVFECLVEELIDRLYELGAYDMFYSGMID